MVRKSSTTLIILNLLSLLLSLPILILGIYLTRHATSTCQHLFSLTLIVFASALLFLSLAGLAGTFSRNSILLFLYLTALLLLLLLVVCFTIFSFIVTNKGAGSAVSGKGFKEYRLGDYSNWLQKRVNNENNWNKIKSCMQEARVCNSLGKNRTVDQFMNSELSPIQAGCCKPPIACNFTYKNETFWIETPGFNSSNNNISDCKTWSNDQNVLCYNCQSCKAGVLALLKHDWKKVLIANVLLILLLIVVYSVGCCAYRNIRREGYELVHK